MPISVAASSSSASPGPAPASAAAIVRSSPTVHDHRAVFLLGFAKSARDNIALHQLADLKECRKRYCSRRSNGEIAADVSTPEPLQEARL